MTDVFLDGAKIDFEDADNSATVGDFVAAVERELAASGRFIAELWLDGVQAGESGSREALARTLIACGSLRLVTGSVDRMVADGVAIIREYAGYISKSILTSARELRLGTKLGFAAVTPVFEGLKEIARVMDAIVKSRGSHAGPCREDLAEHLSKIAACMEKLKSANAVQDTILLADILEYELSAVLTRAQSDMSRFFHEPPYTYK